MATRSRSVHGVLLLACLCFQAHLTLQQCLNDCLADPVPGQWTSQLTVGDDLLLTWAPDTFVTPTEYIIEARSQNDEIGFVAISQQESITIEMFSLGSHLEPNTIYDVRVCRAIKDDERTDNCGDCTLCVDTGPAARPDTVTNVQVFIYRPNTDNSVLTGLVTWDPVGLALNYTVTVRLQGGAEIPNLFMSPFPDTSYVILQFNPPMLSTLTPSSTVYPLVQGQSYEVEVVATNEAGSNTMTPLTVPFTVDEPNYPQQVLAVGADGGQILGNNLTIVRSDLSISGAAPTIVDTIGRMAYWYSRSDNIIYSQSLHTGPRNVFLSVPSDKIVLALAFDWIGKQVYMLRRSTNSLQLEIMRVLIHDTDNSLTNVFPGLLEVAGSIDSSFQLMMNPFTGFIYWTEDIPTGRGLLHRLNLRDTASTTSATFGSIAERRKRSQRIRSKRQTQSLSSITLNPALAQDVMTGELLLSDSTSGDIMRCNLTDSNCVVEVDHADLLTTTGRGNVGLPATSFVLTEGCLYWSSSELSDRGVYAVDLSSRQDLIVISETIAASSLSGLDPGQQKLAADQICLSPDFSNIINRVTFQEERVVQTSTTILLAWNLITAPLREMCDDVVFSIPPYTFFVEYEEAFAGFGAEVLFATYTRKHRILVEDLMPFTAYNFDVAVANEFTLFIIPGIDYHSTFTITTLEGEAETGATAGTGTTEERSHESTNEPNSTSSVPTEVVSGAGAGVVCVLLLVLLL